MSLFFSGISLWSLGLLILGLAFLAAEIIHPGFGLPGILGILCLALDILISARTLAQGLWMTALAAVIVFLFLLLGATLVSRGKLPKWLVLREENSTEAGFVSAGSAAVTPGAVGTAATVLRPAGIAEFSGRRLDAVTQGEVVEAGEALRVLRTEGGRVVVCREPETDSEHRK